MDNPIIVDPRIVNEDIRVLKPGFHMILVILAIFVVFMVESIKTDDGDSVFTFIFVGTTLFTYSEDAILQMMKVKDRNAL